ncbi:GNAT family N-acetyltransferase [Streptococcus loxodontisalivarius]|uniref:N-acetylglutamate synthase-like GNAT family acetyltransferase n=1 Tax=Streptococcus loxodontisalivarius TaxID=1349415 RepID=A0ABS2PR68_9STRE|nr:GNAT family N-acetyltransferase [Streptococcus loxodontisalivarius]MBM7642538.1 N-acetylglutamate synthase-like GNAT family acetyltransferase [Streptococcus loxodontisalivarius]
MRIEIFDKSDNQEVADLVLHIQRQEFGIVIADGEQTDLQDLEATYQKTGGQFWVAKNDVNQIIGCIGLLSLKNSSAALKKMFVAADYRQLGVGRALIDKLLDYCRQTGIESVYLGTVDRFQAAQRFYQTIGFKLVEKEDLPEDFPFLEVDNRNYLYRLD